VKYTKDPQAVLDYKIDWTEWMPANDKIVASTFTSSDVELTVDDSLFTDFTATVWLSGGVAGERYTVTNHIVTEDGREDDRSLTIVCKQL
jgi:hypothetical protein